MTTTIDELLELIPSQHRDQPRFRAWCAMVLEPFRQAAELALSLPEAFDLDTAVGAQLDALGLWIGRSRFVQVPISDYFFTWDTTALEGWGAVWAGEFESPDQLVKLNDDDYRKLLRAKVSANNWNGNRAGQYRTLREAFGPAKAAGIVIQDNQDMSMTVLFNSTALTATERTLLVKEYVLIRPCGVGLNFESYFLPPAELDVFRGGSPFEDGEILWAGTLGLETTFDGDDWLVAKAWTPFSEETTVVIKAGGAQIGTAVFPAGGTAPVSAVCTLDTDERIVGADEVVELVGPVTAPAAGGDASFNFLGYRNPTFG